MSLIGKRWKKFPEPQPLPTDQPNITKPLAIIQLPATRTATRAQRARTRVQSGTGLLAPTNSAVAVPKATAPLARALASFHLIENAAEQPHHGRQAGGHHRTYPAIATTRSPHGGFIGGVR